MQQVLSLGHALLMTADGLLNRQPAGKGMQVVVSMTEQQVFKEGGLRVN
jgi:hypothetical protein